MMMLWSDVVEQGAAGELTVLEACDDAANAVPMRALQISQTAMARRFTGTTPSAAYAACPRRWEKMRW